jgi:FkbH-like protein
MNILQISRRLNLKTKDFVFIDDRADERALVAEAMPEITVLDGNSLQIWEQIAVLAEILPENTEGDRTLAYKQREKRERFLNESGAGDQLKAVDDVATLHKLQLELRIRFAGQKELGRVIELINRTNQFNMNAARTTSKEAVRWHSSSVHSIWVAEARDKFGEMGTIAVAVTEKTSRGLEIIAFVLSCRVFGFGMERALLGSIQRSAMGDAVIGLFRETAHNGPCHRTYPDNGFRREGSDWVSRGSQRIEDPSWLKVVDSTPSPGTTRAHPSLVEMARTI